MTDVTSGAGTAYPSGAPEFTPIFSGVRVTRSLVLYVCFVDHCLSFCTFSLGHCVVCFSSIYGFWLPLWYLQIILVKKRTNSTLSLPVPIKGSSWWNATYHTHFKAMHTYIMSLWNKIHISGPNKFTCKEHWIVRPWGHRSMSC